MAVKPDKQDNAVTDQSVNKPDSSVNKPSANDGGLNIDTSTLQSQRSQGVRTNLDSAREVPVWDKSDAPDGSTSESLLVYEGGKPVRVSGPTHYTTLANGQIVGGYGIGTHHSVANDDGTETVTPIVSHVSGV